MRLEPHYHLAMKRPAKRASAAKRTAEAATTSSSLRQRLRLMGRDTILDVASELFLERGYRTTTIGTIAERAGVGVATVFRYFNSKEGILAALSRRDIDKVNARVRAAIASLPEDPAQAVLRVFSTVLQMHQMPSTHIRGQTRLWLLVTTGHPETDEVVTSSDRELQQMIRDLLAHYRKIGRISKNLDLDDLSIVLFAVFYHHYMRMGLDRSVRVEEVTADLARHIPIVFASWTTPAIGQDASKERRRTASR